MTAAHMLPEGTVLALHGDLVPVSRIVRVKGGWDEVDPHCLDCVGEWRAQVDGSLQPNWYAESDQAEPLQDVLKREDGWTVEAVPAEWLAARIESILGEFHDDWYSGTFLQRVSDLAHDAGLQ